MKPRIVIFFRDGKKKEFTHSIINYLAPNVVEIRESDGPTFIYPLELIERIERDRDVRF